MAGRMTSPYVIAEIGVNHEGSLKLAREQIKLAAEGGADAAKFQAYTAEKLAARESPAYWDTDEEPTESQYRLFQKYDDFGENEYRELASHCNATGIDFLCTPFDEEAVKFLAPLMPCFKVASADITNVPLLRRIASYGKPIILSTGGSSVTEIKTAVSELESHGAEEIALLHCVLNYPTADEDAHLAMIEGLAEAFPDRVVGYSDHTLPDERLFPLLVAYLKGARVIEKHFTHDKSLPGNDHYHAMDVEDLSAFTAEVERIQTLLGPTTRKKPLESEQVARENARRSIVVNRPVSEGELLTEDVLTCKRPGTGVSPLRWDEVVGRTAARDLESDRILEWDDLDPKP